MGLEKRIGCLTLAAGLLLSLTACQPAAPGEQTPPPAISDTTDDEFDKRTELAKVIDFKEDDGMMLAVAYLGYGQQTAEATLAAMAPNYSPNGKDLLQDLDFIDFGGDEYYLLVPRFAAMELTVEKRSVTADTGVEKVDETRIRGSAQPFLLRCNPSDIYSNARVTITNEDWSGDYSPAISLRDGGLVSGEFVLDITDYVSATANPEARQ